MYEKDNGERSGIYNIKRNKKEGER